MQWWPVLLSVDDLIDAIASGGQSQGDSLLVSAAVFLLCFHSLMQAQQEFDPVGLQDKGTQIGWLDVA